MGKHRRIRSRDAVTRYRKWDAKVRGDVYAEILESVKPLALPRVQQYQHDHEWILRIVQEEVGRLGVELANQHEYQNFALQIYRLIRTYSSAALRKEADAAFLHHVYRGADERLLRNIAKRLGVEISGWDSLLASLGFAAAPTAAEVEESFKRALEEASTLTSPAVARNPLKFEFYYDGQNRIAEIVITDLVTGAKKVKRLEYDEEGYLVNIREEVE